MKLIRGISNLKPFHGGCVATIGNFDGMHLGHQRLVQQVCSKAVLYSLPSVVITFEPLPQEYFAKQNPWPRLTKLREKLFILKELGVDYVLCLSFNEILANLTAQQFLEQILISQLRIKHLVIGDDFHFGQGREGNFSFLQQAARQFSFTVEEMPTFLLDNIRVSSRRVRDVLGKGDLHMASRLLGRPYTLCGRVLHGNKRGRIIGFPTANIFLGRKVSPVLGVYAVKVYGIESYPFNGVANVGNRPTVDGTRTLLEVHLFEFDRDLYGQHLVVEFAHKLRDEKRFDNFDLLKEQILLDAKEAKDFFKL